MDVLGEAATQLPWLSPSAASLVALTRTSAAAAWQNVRHDPGCALLLVRSLPTATAPGLSCFASALRDPVTLDAAARHVRQRDPGFAPWNVPPFRAPYCAALACAQYAETIAACAERADPANAWVAGLLTPLGRLAVCAASASRTAINGCPSAAVDHAPIARRLARQWGLPPWLAAVVGNLELPAEFAQTLGADPDLFCVAQLAAHLAIADGHDLGQSVVGSAPELAAALGLSAGELDEIRTAGYDDGASRLAWQSPLEVPLLAELLQLAADNRRLRAWPALERAEQDVDALQRAVVVQRRGEGERLHRAKLASLGEVAAGAGHEINNPLAVISGQAQYLLTREDDPERRRSLQTIVSQANRIHQTVTDLMQFARPQPPRRQALDGAALAREVAAALHDFAEHRQVRVVLTEPTVPVTVFADPAQLRTAVRALLRNAIEAAPAEGWASLRLHRDESGAVDFVFEDNGHGPTDADRDHMFDPFYSGRKAGRGRGLGLPTAWRLARQHGGDVFHDNAHCDATRFVLTLPAAQEASEAEGMTLPERNGTNGCHVPAVAVS